MTKPILWALLICLPLCAAGQNTYVKHIGTTESDLGISCIPTADMGTMLALYGGMPGGGVRFALVKTDHNGTMQWNKPFVHDNFALPQTVVQTADGGFVVFGAVAHPSGNGQALFLLKTDAQGNMLWSHRLPASTNDRPVGLLACKAGGYVSCSVSDYNGMVHPRAMLIRYNENGGVVWAKEYRGTYGILPVAVTELPDGDIAFVSSARFYLTDPFEHMLVTRTDPEGNMRWSALLGLEYDDEPHDIAANAYGELYVTGATYRMGHEWDGFLLKLDAQGNRMFNRFYDAGTAMGDIFRCVSVTPQGSVLLLGDMGAFEERDITLLSVDAQGQTRWARRYPFSPNFTNYPCDGYNSYNGGFVFTGDVRPPTSIRNALLVRADSLGNVPCSNQPASYTTYDTPFWLMNPPVSTSAVQLPASEPLPFTHPPVPITEHLVCENPLPVVLNKWNPSDLCPNVCMDFEDTTLNNPTAWLWEFEGATPSTSTQQHPQNICYAQKGTYTVSLTATNAWGTVTQHKKIFVQETECPPPVIPNVFSPNGDGVNDEFLIDQLPVEFTFHIYNRWGEVVFSSSEKSHVWKGKNKLGLPVSDGVYFYSLSTLDKDYHGFIHVFH